MATQPGRLNPYKLGIELFRDIEERWNKGQFGPEWDECDDYERPPELGQAARPGPPEDLRGPPAPQRRDLHRHVPDRPTSAAATSSSASSTTTRTRLYEIESREFKKIKERLLFGLTNFGQPIIRVKDGNYRNRGELYLQHEHFGVDLKLDHAQDTLRHLHRLWTRPVHIETCVDGRPTLLSFDGTDHTIRPLGGSSHEPEPKDRRRA